MVSFTDVKHLPPYQRHQIVADAQRARRLAIGAALTADRQQRQAAALAEAEQARQRIDAAGGIKSLTREQYQAELQAMQRRLRRSR